jgi:hypothetical protein
VRVLERDAAGSRSFSDCFAPKRFLSVFIFASFPALRRAGLLTLSVAMLALGGCKKDKDDAVVVPDPTSQPITLEFEHVGSDGAPLKYGTAYTTALGAKYTVDSLKYYVSNISFRRVTTGADSIWVAPEAYYLVRATSAPAGNVALEIPNVPLGTYSRITFSIGVSNSRNYTGDQAGVLNPKYGMLWSWRTGYKFLTLDGKYRPAPGDSAIVEYHLGTDALYPKMTLKLPFPTNATVTKNIAPEIHFAANVNQLFGGPNQMDLTNPGDRRLHSGGDRVATNLRAGMFEVEHIHNDPK